MTNQAFIFKVRDYVTELVGRRVPHPDREHSRRKDVDQWVYYVERGDGTQYRYDDYRVEWARELVLKEESRGAKREGMRCFNVQCEHLMNEECYNVPSRARECEIRMNKPNQNVPDMSAPESGSVLAVRIDDFYQVTCPHCGSQTRFFDVRENGTQNCIDCRKVIRITKPTVGAVENVPVIEEIINA